MRGIPLVPSRTGPDLAFSLLCPQQLAQGLAHSTHSGKVLMGESMYEVFWLLPQGLGMLVLCPDGSVSSLLNPSPIPLAATHLHVPHPPGAVVITMLCAQQRLTQVEPLQLKQG